MDVGVDCSWIRAVNEERMKVLTEEDTGVEIGFELVLAGSKEVVVTKSLKLSVGVEDESVRGGKPKTWPLV